MESLHLEDYVPFLLITGILLLGSMLVFSHTPILQFSLHLFLFPVIHFPVIGSLFLVEGIVFGGIWCYVFYQKLRLTETEGAYICPRRQAHNHPDSTICKFCFQDLEYTFELRTRSKNQHFAFKKTPGVCSGCGEPGNYYRRDRWFCFKHRGQGR